MMFVYTPEGATPKKWPFEPEKLMNAEAEAIERLTRMDFMTWSQKVRSGSVLAIHGLLYVLLKRTIPTLKWDEVAFNMSEIDFELDDDETTRMIEALEAEEAEGTLDPPSLALLRQMREQAADREPPVPAESEVVEGELASPEG